MIAKYLRRCGVQSGYFLGCTGRDIEDVHHTFPSKPQIVGVDVPGCDTSPRLLGATAGVGGIHKAAFVLHEVLQVAAATTAPAAKYCTPL